MLGPSTIALVATLPAGLLVNSEVSGLPRVTVAAPAPVGATSEIPRAIPAASATRPCFKVNLPLVDLEA
jgi:hypothetical protein